MRSETQALASEPVLFTSYQQKRTAWPRFVLPQIIARANEAAQGDDWQALAQWLAARGCNPAANQIGNVKLAALHNAARQGTYKDDPPGFDVVYPVALTRALGRQGIYYPATIDQGGDCDDWTAVILAALLAWQMPARIITVGNEQDPFQHVYPRARAADGLYRTLDAKGSQKGLDYDQQPPRSMFPVRQAWAWHWNKAHSPARLEISQDGQA